MSQVSSLKFQGNPDAAMVADWERMIECPFEKDEDFKQLLRENIADVRQRHERRSALRFLADSKEHMDRMQSSDIRHQASDLGSSPTGALDLAIWAVIVDFGNNSILTFTDRTFDEALAKATVLSSRAHTTIVSNAAARRLPLSAYRLPL